MISLERHCSCQEKGKKKVDKFILSIYIILYIYIFSDDDDNTISVRSALIRLLNDNDHSVRVHCAKIITVLFSNTLSGNEQLSNFDEVKKMLQKAYLVKVLSNIIDFLVIKFFSLIWIL